MHQAHHIPAADGRKMSTRRRRWLTWVFTLIFGAGINTAAKAVQIPFAAPPTITGEANGARSVFMADVDRDGDLDALSASRFDNKIAWYENDGSAGGWTSHTISTAAVGARSVYAADVDGDGDLDALSASSTDNKIAWYENDGAGGGWTLHTISTAASAAEEVYAADVDGDGDIDVLSASSLDNKIAWYENDGSGGTWTSDAISTAVQQAHSVYAADVDGDGDVDALSASYLDDVVFWHENLAGDGSSWMLHSISTTASGAESVFAADVDGDGDLDALSASRLDAKIAWYENDGTGATWTPHTISSTANGAFGVYAADVDGDGDVDALSASFADDKIAWYENNDGAGGSWVPRTISTGADQAYSVFAADVDGDGDLDVVSASGGDDEIAWYRNDTIHRSAVFPAQSILSTDGYGARCVFAADLNGDGDLDVLSCSWQDDTVSWFQSNGDGSFGSQQIISTTVNAVYSVFAADLDGDGDLDVLSASFYDDRIDWFENDGGGAFGSKLAVASGISGVYSVIAADVDGDGDLDVLSASLDDDRIDWFENTDGEGSFGSRQAINTSNLGSRAVQAGDLDGDGDLDVFSATLTGLTWSENDGSGSFGAPQSISPFATRSVAAADLDADGDLDVVAIGTITASQKQFLWYENTDGAGSFGSAQLIDDVTGSPRYVFLADIDGDGDIDLRSALPYSDKVVWYENTDGAGGFGAQQVVSTLADGVKSIFAADVDGDGDTDVLSASQYDSVVAWYENLGGQFALPATVVAQKVVGNSQVEDLLAIQVVHRGRAGDTDVELVLLRLLFTNGAGTPLSTTQANNLIQELRVYLDDGSGAFEASNDTEVAAVVDLSLSSGVQAVSFVDGDPGVRVAFGTPRTYFVVVEMTGDAESQIPSAFAVEHLFEAGPPRGQDADNDIPLIQEFADSVETGKVDTALSSASCQAPFDLNLSDRTVDSLLVCEAGTVLRAGSSFVVVTPGDVTFRSGARVELQSGFDVQSGAFTVEIDSGLLPP
jgi:hypothetical protein